MISTSWWYSYQLQYLLINLLVHCSFYPPIHWPKELSRQGPPAHEAPPLPQAENMRFVAIPRNGAWFNIPFANLPVTVDSLLNSSWNMFPLRFMSIVPWAFFVGCRDPWTFLLANAVIQKEKTQAKEGKPVVPWKECSSNSKRQTVDVFETKKIKKSVLLIFLYFEEHLDWPWAFYHWDLTVLASQKNHWRGGSLGQWTDGPWEDDQMHGLPVWFAPFLMQLPRSAE